MNRSSDYKRYDARNTAQIKTKNTMERQHYDINWNDDGRGDKKTAS